MIIFLARNHKEVCYYLLFDYDFIDKLFMTNIQLEDTFIKFEHKLYYKSEER